MIKGQHKGLMGQVVEATDSHVKVELHSKLKKVFIERNKARLFVVRCLLCVVVVSGGRETVVRVRGGRAEGGPFVLVGAEMTLEGRSNGSNSQQTAPTARRWLHQPANGSKIPQTWFRTRSVSCHGLLSPTRESKA